MKSLRPVLSLLALASVLVFISGCADIKRIADSLTNVSKLEFSLDGVERLNVEGVDVDKINTLKDIKVMDGVQIANAYRNGHLNTSFIINVLAENPNGTQKDQKNLPATIENLEWDLYIDNVKTISGGLANPVKVPGGGATEIIPLRIQLDLMEYFENQGYEKLIDLALRIGGMRKEPSVLRLSAKPTVSTSIGPISYPGRINIEHEL